MDRRRRRYWDLCDFSVGHGLEIGPLHRAMVHRSEGDVSYVDVQDREGLRAHYAGDAGVPLDAIPEIDYTLIQPDGRTLTVAEAAKAGAPFDWVMASHVIEHVPDVIGWLQDIGELVADDGVLVLAVPDRRYCFDVHRPPTTVGQMIEAHDLGATRPSVRAVYDYFTSVVDADVKGLWRGETPTYDRRIHGVAEALAKIDEARAGQYVDCHVWMFSPDSFLDQLHELRLVGLSPWFVEEIVPTPRNDLEFRVRMRRLPRGGDPAAPIPAEVLGTAERPDWLADELVADLRTRLATQRERVAGLRDRLRESRRVAAEQARELGALRASRQWRVGGSVLAPVRHLRRLAPSGRPTRSDDAGSAPRARR